MLISTHSTIKNYWAKYLLLDQNTPFFGTEHLFAFLNQQSNSMKNLEDLPKPVGSAARPSLSNLALSKVLKASINCSFLSASYRGDRWNLPLKDKDLGSRFTRGKKMMTTRHLEGSERAKMIRWTKEAYEVCETRCFKMDTSKSQKFWIPETMVSLHDFYT